MVEIHDPPGIDDAVESDKIFSFIKDNIDYIIPVIIFPLTNSPLDTVKFSELIDKVQNCKKITVVFTHLENLMSGTKHLL